LHNPPANGKQGPIPEEMFQTLLTNEKQGNLDSVQPTTLLIQQTRINGEKTLCFLNSFEQLKN
jgi:hypothetical protein